MKKRIIFIVVGALYLVTVSFTKSVKTPKVVNVGTPTVATTKQDEFSPLLGKSFVGFKEALAFKESQGRYKVVNKLGYLGKYQFGKSTLRRFDITDTKVFLSSPKLQEQAFIALCSLNKWILRRDIKRYVGKTINGVKITESGILAAAHLSGAGSVKKYLRSGGTETFSDAFGTTIKSYLKKFAGYDTSFIKASRTPAIS